MSYLKILIMGKGPKIRKILSWSGQCRSTTKKCQIWVAVLITSKNFIQKDLFIQRFIMLPTIKNKKVWLKPWRRDPFACMKETNVSFGSSRMELEGLLLGNLWIRLPRHKVYSKWILCWCEIIFNLWLNRSYWTVVFFVVAYVDREEAVHCIP